jgi:8-oxo-dGTP pyrophosphatase MutT (NUDIX family)
VADLHGDALGVLRAWSAPDPVQEGMRREYVAHLGQHPDGASRDCLPDHLTASTLVVSADHTQVLLTLHAKAGEWFQLGGHCEAGDATLAAAALREATEESGIDGLRLVGPGPVQLSTHPVPFCGTGGRTRHLDVRFLAVAPHDGRHVTGPESLDLRWWPVDALPTAEPGLLELVGLARRRLQRTSSEQSGGSAAIPR